MDEVELDISLNWQSRREIPLLQWKKTGVEYWKKCLSCRPII